MTSRDKELLAEAYEQRVARQLPEFIQNVKKHFDHLNPNFGIEDQGENKGKMFAIMDVKYDDGDKWEYDTRVIYDNGGGYQEGYSAEEISRLKNLTKKHPELN